MGLSSILRGFLRTEDSFREILEFLSLSPKECTEIHLGLLIQSDDVGMESRLYIHKNPPGKGKNMSKVLSQTVLVSFSSEHAPGLEYCVSVVWIWFECVLSVAVWR